MIDGQVSNTKNAVIIPVSVKNDGSLAVKQVNWFPLSVQNLWFQTILVELRDNSEKFTVTLMRQSIMVRSSMVSAVCSRQTCVQDRGHCDKRPANWAERLQKNDKTADQQTDACEHSRARPQNHHTHILCNVGLIWRNTTIRNNHTGRKKGLRCCSHRVHRKSSCGILTVQQDSERVSDRRC